MKIFLSMVVHRLKLWLELEWALDVVSLIEYFDILDGQDECVVITYAEACIP